MTRACSPGPLAVRSGAGCPGGRHILYFLFLYTRQLKSAPRAGALHEAFRARFDPTALIARYEMDAPAGRRDENRCCGGRAAVSSPTPGTRTLIP